MSTQRTIAWMAGCGAVAALATALVFVPRTNRPQLPALVHHDNLPASFQQALERANREAHENDTGAEAIRRLARLYQANRLNSEARACYHALESIPPGLNAHDHYYLADLASSDNDLAGAERELRLVLQTEPRYVPARLTLADALFKSGRTGEAETEYTAIVAIEPEQPQAAYGLARVDLQQENDAAALARLEPLVASHPEATAGIALLAQILDRRGEVERATALTHLSQQAHEPAVADPWNDAMLSDCYDLHRLALIAEQDLSAGQIAEALPLLQRIEQLDPENWIAPTLRGWNHERAGEHREAAEDYRRALQRRGNPEMICPLLAAALFELGRPAEAATMLAEYHAKLPASLPILKAYAEAAVRAGDSTLARRLLTQLLAIEPYLYLPNMSMVTLLWNGGEHDAAAKYLARVASVFPNDVDSRGLLGQFYLEKSEPERALAPLEQALVHAPASSPTRERLVDMLGTAYLMSGSVDAQEGNFTKAAQLAEKAIQLSPDNLRAYALKANVCSRVGDFHHAADALARIVALQPGNAVTCLSLGDALYQDNNAEAAKRAWQQALQFAPSDATELRAAIDLRLSGRITNETFQRKSP